MQKKNKKNPVLDVLYYFSKNSEGVYIVKACEFLEYIVIHLMGKVRHINNNVNSDFVRI